VKILLDTNIIVDDALEREPFLEVSEQVLVLVEQGQVEGYISASTFSDLYYIIRRAIIYSKNWNQRLLQIH
jgi:predicted nucleic acid-binding protein